MTSLPPTDCLDTAVAAHAAIPVSRPLLPAFDRLAPYLQRVDAARYYTNFGQLHDELLHRLALKHEVASSHLALANSGTSALIGLVLAVAGYASKPGKLCICPSYTFVASAVAARACGYTPFLTDIDEASWMMVPGHVESLPQITDAAVVIVVAPYGVMPDVAAWEAFSTRTGLPVIIDAAACFDTINAAGLCRGRVSAAISLHATKTLSTAEGGLILCGDRSVVERAGRALNFGFHNNRESTGPSINGKISEYHAAIGLAELDGWKAKRDGFIRAARTYAECAAAHGLQSQIIADQEHANPYVLFMAASGSEAAAVMDALDMARIGHRRWYGMGLHRQPEYRACPAEDLTVTDRVAERLIGLPHAPDMAASDVARVVSAIAAALRQK